MGARGMPRLDLSQAPLALQALLDNYFTFVVAGDDNDTKPFGARHAAGRSALTHIGLLLKTVMAMTALDAGPNLNQLAQARAAIAELCDPPEAEDAPG